MYQLNNDPDVVRYTGDGPFVSEVAAREFFRERLKYYEQVGMGRWLVELRATGEILGWCGLKLLDADDPQGGSVDLGYRLFQRHWGRGYATEASCACLDYGFGPLALPRILIRVDPANTASLNVAGKLGARLLPDLEACGGLRVRVFELTAADWLNRAAGT